MDPKSVLPGQKRKPMGLSKAQTRIPWREIIKQIIADVKALPIIDWTAFIVDVSNEVYEKAAAPLSTLNELVTTLLAVIIVVSVVILALILTLWTKTRIHEIGVFLSVGIRKSAIIGQYLVEVLLIAVFAFGLSYFTSNVVAGQIGNHLLEQSVQVESDDDDNSSAAAAEVGADDFMQTPLPTEKGIQISIGLESLVMLYIIGFAIIIVAVCVSSITVMRLKPREILSKMS